jgi:hypothetical protein
MSQSTFQQALLKDPLSSETRKERRILLVVSAVGIVMIKTGLVPTKMAAIGIEFSPADQSIFLNVVAALTIYFFLTFIIYALTDLWSYRLESFLTKVQILGSEIKMYSSYTKGLKTLTDEWQQLTSDLQSEIEQRGKALEERRNKRIELQKYTAQLNLLRENRSDENREEAKEVLALVAKAASELRELEKVAEIVQERDAQREKKEEELQQRLLSLESTKDIANARSQKFATSAFLIAMMRILFELLIPILVGGYAIIILLFRY